MSGRGGLRCRDSYCRFSAHNADGASRESLEKASAERREHELAAHGLVIAEPEPAQSMWAPMKGLDFRKIARNRALAEKRRRGEIK